MRTFGLLMIVAGIVGFFYCSSHMSGLPEIPDGTALGDYVRTDAGRYELGRYLSLMSGFIGLLLYFFPKGR